MYTPNTLATSLKSASNFPFAPLRLHTQSLSLISRHDVDASHTSTGFALFSCWFLKQSALLLDFVRLHIYIEGDQFDGGNVIV